VLLTQFYADARKQNGEKYNLSALKSWGLDLQGTLAVNMNLTL
jgi:hypothetical protein